MAELERPGIEYSNLRLQGGEEGDVVVGEEEDDASERGDLQAIIRDIRCERERERAIYQGCRQLPIVQKSMLDGWYERFGHADDDLHLRTAGEIIALLDVEVLVRRRVIGTGGSS